MTLISSLAMWFSNNDGKLIIEWFGWQVTTSPALFLSLLLSLIFILYIIISFIVNLINIPRKTLKKLKEKKIINATEALNNGIIASFYGNKEGILKNLNIAKKSLTNLPLLTLLELQNSIYKGDQNNTFILLTKMLDIDILKPLAIKSLISYSIKNKDKELFNNVLNKSLDKKIDFAWIKRGVFHFCYENKNWKELSIYLEKKISFKSKFNKEILSITYYQMALDYYFVDNFEKANFFLQKALKLNKYFPPFMELYSKLNKGKSNREIIKVLKNYWLKNPNPNIEKCIDYAFEKNNNLSKLKIVTKVLIHNNDLYFKHLILGKFKYKAKIWGSSKSDLKKSINFRPSKDAYYYLYKIERDLNSSKNISEEFRKLYNNCSNISLWRCFNCNASYDNWASFCQSCNTFNSINNISKNSNNYIYEENNLEKNLPIL
ncbi:MAG: hypothetical protein CBC22_04375 [Alphaproteobacteria bacterium TMED62]|nr:MAG: hypothetical protein CBC22_04375 [Alphaproteobacteria bacterium TMED62]|tara:strand:+ start:11344 stop:12642 length:1299 start_codon:yes stop_codon:yes gene_type:complete